MYTGDNEMALAEFEDGQVVSDCLSVASSSEAAGTDLDGEDELGVVSGL